MAHTDASLLWDIRSKAQRTGFGKAMGVCKTEQAPVARGNSWEHYYPARAAPAADMNVEARQL